MNEFLAKKLGEVLAFERMAENTMNKGRAALNRAYGEDEVENMHNISRGLAEKIDYLAADNGEFGKVIALKAEATGKKLENMRAIYLSEDDWDDPVEILEWSGAFEGGAIVHWSLVEGGAERAKEEDIKNLAMEGAEFHADILGRITEIIYYAEEL